MKKTLLLAVAAVFVLGATSCKKDRTCECCADVPLFGKVCDSKTIKDTKKKATDACDALEQGGAKCELK